MRTFDTGATRDTDENKPDYEGFLSPLVIERYGEYMSAHRKQADGGLRDSDNWQKGIPLNEYMKSMMRHLIEVWSIHRGWNNSRPALEEALCALMFNTMGYLHEHIKKYAMSSAIPDDPVIGAAGEVKVVPLSKEASDGWAKEDGKDHLP